MSLDIAEPQVLVQYPGERPEWQQYILLRRLRDATWVVLSTERQVQVLDLGQHTLIPLGRGTAIPGVYAARCVFFDADVEDSLPAYHAQAARLAAILGGPAEAAAGAGPAACWRVADTAAPDFGMEVADELVESAASGVIKGAVGLARCGEPPRWVFVERVPLAEVGAWEQDKQSGAGRDRRLGVPRAHLAGAQTLPLAEAVTGWRPRDLRELLDWPHQGPRAITEFIRPS